MFAILDTETTGGTPSDSKITEIAIFLHDGEKIRDQFVSLVNPEVTIPAFITKLTGISNEMVADAPKFFEIAKDIVEITRESVFVAHNSSFDFGMIKKEFRELGYDYNRTQLCTVKASKKIFPGLPSYSLGNLCQSLNIKLKNHHRAEADARATVQIFEMLYANVGADILQYSGGSTYKSNNPVANEIISTIPDVCGVYYLKNTKGEIIFVGHAKNIRKAVWAHFKARGSKWSTELSKSIADVNFTDTGSFLLASLLAKLDIEGLQPQFNLSSVKRKKESELLQMELDTNLLIIDRGTQREQRSVIILQNDDSCHFGLVDMTEQLVDVSEIKNRLPYFIKNKEVRKVISGYLKENKVESVISF